MKRFRIILNPVAGRGRAKRAAVELMRELVHQQMPYTIEYTQSPNHATELARQAVSEGEEVIVVVGGDGTVQEAANALVNTSSALAVIPRGSGNDFSKLLNMPNEISTILQSIREGTIEQFDTGIFSYKSMNVPLMNDRLFVNHLGIGFDARVALESRKTRWLNDTPLYVWAVLKTIMTYSPSAYEIEIDGKKIGGRYYLIAIGNGISVGGGFYITPDADPKDGLFDICLIDDINKVRVFQVLPSVLRGTHMLRSEVHFYRGKHLRIKSERPICVHADGEIVGQDIVEMEVNLSRNSLNVVSGKHFRNYRD